MEVRCHVTEHACHYAAPNSGRDPEVPKCPAPRLDVEKLAPLDHQPDHQRATADPEVQRDNHHRHDTADIAHLVLRRCAIDVECNSLVFFLLHRMPAPQITVEGMCTRKDALIAEEQFG